jgi:alcohol dehydrogenase (NADP+)
MEFFEFVGGGRMPALGLGTWKAEPGVVGAAVREALRIGYRHIDCAPIYMNQKEIGEALDAALAAGEVRRETLWVTSKLWCSDHARSDVVPALERTLADLRLDYLDLFLIHWPVAFRSGIGFPETPTDFTAPEDAPLTETWAGMEEVVGNGLCRYIGVSNFSRTQIADLLAHASIQPAVNQVECHPYLAQRDLLAYCQDHGIVLTAYSPLGSSDRAAALKRPDEPRLLDDPIVLAVAEKHNASPAQVLIAWAMQRGTSVIPKSSSPERLRENFAAAVTALEEEDMALIDALDRGYRFIDGAFWCPEGSPYTLDWLWG